MQQFMSIDNTRTFLRIRDLNDLHIKYKIKMGEFPPDENQLHMDLEAPDEEPMSGWPPNIEWYGTWYLLLADSSYRMLVDTSNN
jgi:hypothetical protein